jgi:hypothetical protein
MSLPSGGWNRDLTSSFTATTGAIGEEAAGVRYVKSGDRAEQTKTDSPVVIRYVDLCGIPHKSAYVDRRIMPTVA